MTAFISTDVVFFDNVNGSPAALGTVYFGKPNTDPEVPANVKVPYTDYALTTPTTSTQSLTTAGKLSTRLYLDGAYSITVNDADGVQIFNDPYVTSLGSGGGGGGGGTVESIVAGTGIGVDDTDPANPIVSATGASTVGKQSLWIPAGSMRPSISSGCDYLAAVITSAGCPDLEYYAFPNGVALSSQMSLRMPKRWNQGTISFSVVWTHPSTTTNFTTQWALSTIAINDATALATAFPSGVITTDTGGVTQTVYVSPESAAVTVGGTILDESVVFIKLTRRGDLDTLAVDAHLIGITLYYTSDAENDA